jgi:hypothetical protein
LSDRFFEVLGQHRSFWRLVIGNSRRLPVSLDL